MNIAVDALAEGTTEVEGLLAKAGAAVAEAIDAIARLQSRGVRAASAAGVPAGLIGQVLDYAGKANACVSRAAFELSGVHASLHEALERLAPNEDVQKSGGGGGKEVPPKP
jgi:hypothetical protein